MSEGIGGSGGPSQDQVLKAILAGARHGVIVLDRDLRCRLFNPFAEELTGLRASDVIGRFAPDALPLEDLWRCALEGRTVTSADTPYGREGWFSATWSPLRSSGSEIDGVLGILHDITDRKLTELRLQESEQRYRFLLDNLNVGVFQSTAGRLVQANEAVARLAGYDSVQDLLEQPTRGFYADPADRERLLETLQREGRVQDATVRALRRDGTEYWVSMNMVALRDVQGTQDSILGVVADITERRRLEEELRTREERLRSILEHAPMSMAIVGLDGTIEYINQRAVEDFGYPHSEIPDMDHWWQVAYPDEAYRREVQETWTGLTLQAIREGKDIEGREYRVTCKDGSVKTMLILGVPVAQKVFVMFEDVTERRQAAERLEESQRRLVELVEERTRELRVAKDAAESATRAKSLFLANMSHEIRTPMHALMGFLDLVLDSDLQEEQRRFLSLARSRSKDLLVLIDDILDLSRIEAGRLTLAADPFSAEGVLDDVVQMFSRAAAAKGLRLARELAARVPSRVLGDARRVRQVLLNLVGNAIKFTEAGEVVVSVDCADEGLHFRVRDTGIGICPGDAEIIFDPFTQGTTPHAREGGGAGLGLAIARRLAESMGGRLWLESEPGVGTTFHFTARLPEPTSPADAAVPPQEGAGESRAWKLLVVEDDATCRYLLECLLTRRGHQVSSVANGREALWSLAREPFDLVLMDVQMPGMDGLQATRAIRSGDAGALDPHIPILALTAFAMSGDEERCRQAGMDGYLAKPVSGAALASALAQVMSAARR